MILVDTSIWIHAKARDLRVADLVDDDIAICPPIMHELLQGVPDWRRFVSTREMLLQSEILDAPMPRERFEEAARLYIDCRAAAFTIRSAYDCLIAACALANNVPVMALDSDFRHIARVLSLRVFTPGA